MSTHRLISISSIQQLRDQAEAWDDLWQRSDVASPGPRAEIIAHWVETFAGNSAFRGLAVERCGQLVAALPMVVRQTGGFVELGGLPNDDWTVCGDLLLDPAADPAAALTPLIAALADLGWTLFWLDEVPTSAPRWQVFQQLAQNAGMAVHVDPRYEIGAIDIDHDWDKYRAGWSRSHRRKMKRCVQKFSQDAANRVSVHCPVDPDEVVQLLQRGFEVEDRSWKGESGSSVLRNDGMFEYYVKQSQQLAHWGQLEIVFLEHEGRPMAFEMGWTGKGVYHSIKVGYDQQYAAHTPGQLLRYLLLERFFADSSRSAVDFAGVLTDATAKWSTRAYPVGRIVLAPQRFLGRLLLHGYRHWWPRLRRLRQLAQP